MDWADAFQHKYNSELGFTAEERKCESCLLALANTNSNTNSDTNTQDSALCDDSCIQKATIFVQNCWPYLLQHSRLLKMVDILIYSTATREDQINTLKENFEMLFQNIDGNGNGNRNGNRNPTGNNITTATEIKTRTLTTNSSSGTADATTTPRTRNRVTVVQGPKKIFNKQIGANIALIDGAKRNLFQNYDWVIRINPDVLIYNDTFILDTILHDPQALAVLVDCNNEQKHQKQLQKQQKQQQQQQLDTTNSTSNGSMGYQHIIHTDFFAIRSEFLEAYRTADHILQQTTEKGKEKEKPWNAELLATKLFQPVHEQGGARWLPNTGIRGKACRVGDTNVANSPVVHSHGFLDKCPKLE